MKRNPIKPALVQVRLLIPENAEAARGFSCGDENLDDFLPVYYEKWRSLAGLAPLFRRALDEGRALRGKDPEPRYRISL